MPNQHQGIRRTRAVLAALAFALAGPAGAGDQAQAHLGQAKKLLQDGDVRAAVIELKNALQQNPSLGEARRLLGRAYLKAGDGAAAEKELRRARALDGDSPRLALELAETYLLQRRPDEVLKLLPTEPEGPTGIRVDTLTLRGIARAAKRETEEARARFNEALALDPDATRALSGLAQLDLLAGDSQAAERHLDTLLAKHPDDTSALLLKADIQRRAGHADTALALYDRAAKAAPKDVRPLLGRAVVHLIRGQPPQARKDLLQAEELQKGLLMTTYLRGLLAYLDKDLNQAHALLQSVLGKAPQHAPSQLLFGLVSYQRGEYEMVEEFLGRFLTAHPGNLPAIKTLAAARVKLKDAKGAIKLLQPHVTAQTRDVQLLTLLGSAYLMDGQHAAGSELLQEAVELAPDAAPLRTQLALGLMAEGQTGAATEQLQAAVDLGQDVVQADVLLVMSHLRAGEFDQALKVSREMEARMPASPIPYNLTGLAHMARHEPDKARERFHKALEVDPDFVTANANLARLALTTRDFDAAAGIYREILKTDPANQTALIGLAGIAELRGDTQALISHLEQATERNPGSPKGAILLARYYLKHGEGLKALAAIRQAQERAPDNPVVIELLGRAQAVTGEISSAERSFQRLVELAPSEENHLLLARTRLANKDLGGARKAAREALRLAPDSVPAQLLLAAVALDDNRLDDALLIAQALEEKHPDMASGFKLEGLVRRKLGNLSQARSAFEQAYRNEKSADVARRLADTYKQLGEQEKAAAILRDWLQEHPEDVPSRTTLAMTLQLAGDRNGAIEQYEIIQAGNKADAIVLNNLAWLYFENGDPRAAKTAQSAYAADPERPEVADTYGWVLLQSGGDTNKALTVLQEAYVRLPTNPEIGYHVAEALHRLGRDDEAARTLRKLLADNPRFPELDRAKELLETLKKR